ncbi:MAG: DUF427 domain-containing protein [Planctomycetota bacterium]
MARHPTPDPARPGQRSVWDFPRPPAIERVAAPLRVVFEGIEIAATSRGIAVLETSHPPVYFFPSGDVRTELLERTARTSACEWKGRAEYFDLRTERARLEDACFAYPSPTARFEPYAGWLSFYARGMDACSVGDETATPQPGGFYSGWVTSGFAGPFKGVPGSMGW